MRCRLPVQQQRRLISIFPVHYHTNTHTAGKKIHYYPQQFNIFPIFAAPKSSFNGID
jgi:hypothetical protein